MDATPTGVTAASRTGGLGAPAAGEAMTRDELCAAAGVTEELLADLESYGLIVAVTLGGVPSYDAESQLVARAAARYVDLGVEPRHLRMYKVAAEREAGFVEQLVMPLLKQRNPVSREQAVERTDELAGARCRAARVVAAASARTGARDVSRGVSGYNPAPVGRGRLAE